MMSEFLIFNCKCGKKYYTKYRNAGKEIKCNNCNKIILLKVKPEKLKELENYQEIERLKEHEKLKREPEAQNLIIQFAKKFGTTAIASDFSNLQMILSKRKIDFTIDELKKVVSKIIKFQQFENVKIKILATRPSNYQECIKVFLNLSQSSDDEMLKSLLKFLNERNLYIGDLNSLKIEIAKIEKEIELENFERRLSEENEQIHLNYVDKLNGYEFEDFLKKLFSKIGYQVQQTKLSGDQGADLVVVKFGEKMVIQAKRYGAKVGNSAVQEIMAAISLYKAQKGMVITNSYFTRAAVELANANNIELIDRDALEKLINKHW